MMPRGRVLSALGEEEDDEESYREYDDDEPEHYELFGFGRRRRRVQPVRGRQNVSVATPTGTSQVKLSTAMVSAKEINPQFNALQSQLDAMNTKVRNMMAAQQQQQMMSLLGPLLSKKLLDSITFDAVPQANVPVNVTATKQSFDILTLLLVGGLGGLGGGGLDTSSNTGSSQQSSLFGGGDLLSTIVLLKVLEK
jgi:hypothetical protein